MYAILVYVMSKTITARQKQILELVAGFIREHGIPPTIRDVAALYDCSVKGAYDHVLALQRKGYLERNKLKSRGILITPKARAELSDGNDGIVPLYGAIAAGQPVFADSNLQGIFNYPTELPDGSEFFALKVKGDSMNGLGIVEGDIVILRKQENVQTGEIAACLIGDEATLKQVLHKTDKITLRSFNPRYPDRDERSVKILGKLHGLFREY